MDIKKDKPYGRPFRPGARSTIHGIGDLTTKQFQDPHVPLGIARKQQAEAMGMPEKMISGHLKYPSLTYRDRMKHEAGSRNLLQNYGYDADGNKILQPIDYSDITTSSKTSKVERVAKAAAVAVALGAGYYLGKAGTRAIKKASSRAWANPPKNWDLMDLGQKRHYLEDLADPVTVRRMYQKYPKIREEAKKMGLKTWGWLGRPKPKKS